MAISQPSPLYPSDAKAKHVQGTVVMRAIISRTGTVENLEVISGPDPLRQAAADAVSRWKYKPYLLNGQPTEVETTININFTLSPPPAAPMEGFVGSSIAPPSSDARVRIPAGVMAARLISKVDPVVPPDVHESRVVILHALISKLGLVENLEVVGTPANTVKFVTDAVRRWRYDPYLLNGVPVEVQTTISVPIDPGAQTTPPAGP